MTLAHDTPLSRGLRVLVEGSSVEPNGLPHFYSPHHGVLRKQSLTTKLRIIFNGSDQTSSSFSLNDVLHTGVELQADIFDVLLRIRRHQIIFSSDITKMSRQINVHPTDWDLQRILWLDEHNNIVPYQHTTVSCSTRPTLFLVVRVLLQLIQDKEFQPSKSSIELQNGSTSLVNKTQRTVPLVVSLLLNQLTSSSGGKDLCGLKAHFLLGQLNSLNFQLLLTRTKDQAYYYTELKLYLKKIIHCGTFYQNIHRSTSSHALLLSVDSSLPCSEEKPPAPFADQEGILRLGGRLANSELEEDEIHPIILPGKSYFSQLVIDQAHRKTLQERTQVTLIHGREKFWILGRRAPIRSFILRCVIRAQYRARRAQQLMGQLSADRVVPVRPFHTTRVDYAGLFTLKTFQGRDANIYKGWIVNFVCFVTSAVHLDLVSDYSTEALASSVLYRDCGTNFKGADSFLKDRSVRQLISSVLLMKDNFPPAQWPLVRVIPVHPGQGELIQEVSIKTSKPTLTTPIAKLIALPVDEYCKDVVVDGEKTSSDEQRTGFIFHLLKKDKEFGQLASKLNAYPLFPNLELKI
ncbi:CinsV21_orph1 protein [Chelonus insularis]|nr:CinsV21_orph1 protein [Chelonus insularis]